MKTRNYIGNAYKNLIVINQKRENNSTYLLCRCSICGKEKWYRQDYFKNIEKRKFCCANNTRFKIINHSDETINNIELLEITNKKSGTSYLYKCKCFCGKIFYTTYTNIKDKKVRSCGCLKTYRPENLKKANISYKEKYIKDNTNLQLINNKQLSSNNTSGVKGVYFSKTENKWVAFINFKKKVYKKRFNKKEDAIQYRKYLEDKYFKPIIDKYKLD